MRDRDPRKEKARDLRRIARSGNPSIFKLFHKYHPEVKEQEKQIQQEYRARDEWYWHSSEWNILHNMEYDWAIKIAGYWNAIGGAPPADFRRMYNRMHRSRQKAALRKAIQAGNLDDFSFPSQRRNIRWLWW